MPFKKIMLNMLNKIIIIFKIQRQISKIVKNKYKLNKRKQRKIWINKYKKLSRKINNKIFKNKNNKLNNKKYKMI